MCSKVLLEEHRIQETQLSKVACNVKHWAQNVAYVAESWLLDLLGQPQKLLNIWRSEPYLLIKRLLIYSPVELDQKMAELIKNLDKDELYITGKEI